MDPTDINQNWHFHISLICESEYQSEAGRLLQAGSSFRSSRSLSFPLPLNDHHHGHFEFIIYQSFYSDLISCAQENIWSRNIVPSILRCYKILISDICCHKCLSFHNKFYITLQKASHFKAIGKVRCCNTFWSPRSACHKSLSLSSLPLQPHGRDLLGKIKFGTKLKVGANSLYNAIQIWVFGLK